MGTSLSEATLVPSPHPCPSATPHRLSSCEEGRHSCSLPLLYHHRHYKSGDFQQQWMEKFACCDMMWVSLSWIKGFHHQCCWLDLHPSVWSVVGDIALGFWGKRTRVTPGVILHIVASRSSQVWERESFLAVREKTFPQSSDSRRVFHRALSFYPGFILQSCSLFRPWPQARTTPESSVRTYTVAFT